MKINHIYTSTMYPIPYILLFEQCVYQRHCVLQLTNLSSRLLNTQNLADKQYGLNSFSQPLVQFFSSRHVGQLFYKCSNYLISNHARNKFFFERFLQLVYFLLISLYEFEDCLLYVYCFIMQFWTAASMMPMSVCLCMGELLSPLIVIFVVMAVWAYSVG